MRADQSADEKPIRAGWLIQLIDSYGFVARTSGEGPGAFSFRTFLKPASSSQFLISLKLKVSPFSVLTSICTANISEGGGLVRSSFTSHSAIAIVPPDFSARKIFLSN